MKFLLDAHIGRLISDWLIGLGHDLSYAARFAPRTADVEVLRMASAEGRIVMTSDKDFGELVFRMNEPAVGVILLRIDVPSEAERLAVIQKFWSRIESSAAGHFVVVTAKTVRRTPLPPAATGMGG
jgi:predicted nuclease of predicted toxin-antitoxin system